jgi:hypothetical protein
MYGSEYHQYTHHRQQGINLLINSLCQLSIHHITSDTSDCAQYKLYFTISDILMLFLYLPPRLYSNKMQQFLGSLNLTTPNTKQTIICGNFNARIGLIAEDHISNNNEPLLQQWLQKHCCVRKYKEDYDRRTEK